MNSAKLINVLRTFTRNELKEFEKFVSSPFYNRGRNYIPFLNELKRFYPKFEDEKMTPEYIFSRLYHGKKFNKQIIWNMNSGLLNMAEEFLVHYTLKKNSFIWNNMLAEAYHDRKLERPLLKTIDEMERRLEHFGIEEDYFQFKIQIALLRKAYNFMHDAQHLNAEHILKKGEYTILFFLKNMAAFAGDMRSNQIQHNSDFGLNMPYEFIKNMNWGGMINFIRESKYPYAWIMEMYYCMIMLILDFDNTDHFYRLKRLFEENYTRFRHEIKYNWIVWLTNYCIMKISAGADFRKQLFEMNELNLKTGIVFPKKYLSKIIFLRILRNALSAGEVEWSKKYIEEYIPRLRPSLQKSLHAFSYASVYFKLKDYDKVLENLAKVKFIDGSDKLYAKTMYIRTYYELNETETLLLHIDSNRHFLKSNPFISESVKKNHLHFLNVLSKLMSLRENNEPGEIERILSTIKENKIIDHDEWLYEKINELKQMKN